MQKTVKLQLASLLFLLNTVVMAFVSTYDHTSAPGE